MDISVEEIEIDDDDDEDDDNEASDEDDYTYVWTTATQTNTGNILVRSRTFEGEKSEWNQEKSWGRVKILEIFFFFSYLLRFIMFIAQI